MARTDLGDSPVTGSSPFGLPMKRKTPSELREEQLKRKSGELLKTKRYIDTRVSEVYPVKKSSETCRVPNGKEQAKDFLADVEILNDHVTLSPARGFPGTVKSSLPCHRTGKLNSFECSNPFAKDIGEQGSLKKEKHNQHNVAELHFGKKLADPAKIDMEKVLQGLVPCRIPAAFAISANSYEKPSDLPSISGSVHSGFSIMGHRPPLDLTLKTTLRLVSSSSVKWCHRLSTTLATIDSNRFSPKLSCNKDQSFGFKSGLYPTNEVMYSKALHSWVYPQSSLPSSVITAMTLSSTRAGNDFLQRRQHDWENSFQNIYYLLRKNLCNIFYVHTSQFIVLFIGGNFLGKKKRSCNAYFSKSTRGLRSLLRKHDVCFSMPLCRTEVEQASDDDLVELSEIETRNLGQTFHVDYLSDVDNSPESLLAFIGNENAHSLYDFLLNYRSFLNSLTGADVPVIYAPVPFQNSSLCVPEVRCKEMKRADVIPSSSGSGSGEKYFEGGAGLSTGGICYSIEIKETFLPPWLICGVCVAMGSDERTFEASFTTDPASINLNVALDSVCQKSDLVDSNKPLPESGDAFGIPEATVDPCLRSASLRQLKYSNGCYVAHVTPI